MSVTRPRRKRLFALAALAALTVAFTATAATAPAPVKIGPRNEVAPAASDELVRVVEEPREADEPVDLFAQQTGRKAFKVNPKNTQAYSGGIDGTTLVYQLIRGALADRSDLRLYDLADTPAPGDAPRNQHAEVGVLRDDLRRLAPLQPRPGVQP